MSPRFQSATAGCSARPCHHPAPQNTAFRLSCSSPCPCSPFCCIVVPAVLQCSAVCAPIRPLSERTRSVPVDIARILATRDETWWWLKQEEVTTVNTPAASGKAVRKGWGAAAEGNATERRRGREDSAAATEHTEAQAEEAVSARSASDRHRCQSSRSHPLHGWYHCSLLPSLLSSAGSGKT
jgi:hypothetical protein